VVRDEGSVSRGCGRLQREEDDPQDRNEREHADDEQRARPTHSAPGVRADAAMARLGGGAGGGGGGSHQVVSARGPAPAPNTLMNTTAIIATIRNSRIDTAEPSPRFNRLSSVW